jgi:ubiquinone/menaquinone biosynthesis C-methylase UbiE
MTSQITTGVNQLYGSRHGDRRRRLFGDTPYSNFGYWAGNDQPIAEACDALVDRTARASGMRAGDRVLEVGCGYGAGAVFYTRRYEPASVVGLDVTDVRVQGAREYVSQEGLSDRIEVRIGDATALDFPEARFDRVIAVECAFHFKTRREFLREAFRVLAPGGGIGVADLIIRKGADRKAFLDRVHVVGTDGSIDVPENVYDLDVYAETLRAMGFEEVGIEVITDRTLPFFVRHLERLSRDTEGEAGKRFGEVGRIFAAYVELGLEYVLASARKPSG